MTFHCGGPWPGRLVEEPVAGGAGVSERCEASVMGLPRIFVLAKRKRHYSPIPLAAILPAGPWPSQKKLSPPEKIVSLSLAPDSCASPSI